VLHTNIIGNAGAIGQNNQRNEIINQS